MNCTKCREILVEYIEALLQDSDREAVENHLQTCPPCRAELAQLTTLHDRLAENGKAQAETEFVVEDVAAGHGNDRAVVRHTVFLLQLRSKVLNANDIVLFEYALCCLFFQ